MTLKKNRISLTVRKFTDKLRTVLRRTMPTVAMVAMAMFLAWFAVRKTAVYKGIAILGLFGFATACICLMVATYYGARALRWFKRRLLWRVRRRLLITYVFVGLTPIVLLGLLGTLLWFVISNEAMSRNLAAQISASERNASLTGKGLADSYSRQPRMDDRATQQWIDAEARFLNEQFPGVVIVLWRPMRGAGESNKPTFARLVSRASDTRDSEPFSADEGPAAYQVPEWLSSAESWGGVAFIPPPEGTSSAFGSPSFRNYLQGQANGEPFKLLLVAPINSAYLSTLETNTGLSVRPFFVGEANSRIRFGHEQKERNDNATNEDKKIDPDINLGVDQSGKPIKGTVSPLFLSARIGLAGWMLTGSTMSAITSKN